MIFCTEELLPVISKIVKTYLLRLRLAAFGSLLLTTELVCVGQN